MLAAVLRWQRWRRGAAASTRRHRAVSAPSVCGIICAICIGLNAQPTGLQSSAANLPPTWRCKRVSACVLSRAKGGISEPHFLHLSQARVTRIRFESLRSLLVCREGVDGCAPESATDIAYPSMFILLSSDIRTGLTSVAWSRRRTAMH